jgi:preprotein translocase subunit YajC
MTLVDVLLFAAIPVAVWLLLIRPARVRRDAQAALVASLAPGTRIMTTAGVFGTVAAIDGDRMHLEIAPGVVIEMVTLAVGRVLEESAAPTGADPEPAPPVPHDEAPTQEADRG